MKKVLHAITTTKEKASKESILLVSIATS